MIKLNEEVAVPIIVVGSANQDYIVQMQAPPAVGETILASGLRKQPGGKGANQAVAAARLGGQVVFVGCVGDDADGALLLRELRAEGVDTSEVEVVGREPTGLALVSVFKNGENSIIVIPGANFALPSARVSRVVKRVGAAGAVVVVQGEVAPDNIRAALTSAASVRARAILNLAPFMPLGRELLGLCDPLVVNETEAGAMVGWAVRGPGDAAQAAIELREVVRSVVITIGADGAFWADKDHVGYVPAPLVEHVVDTTGAGDAFVGVLAARLAAGASLGDAVEVGVRAGSFAVTRLGAQSSYPMRADVLPKPTSSVASSTSIIASASEV